MGNMLKSKVFWVAVITILVLIAGALFQGYSLDVEAAAGMVTIASVWLVSNVMAPTSSGFIGMLTSRKFWAAVIGFLVLVLNSFHVFPGSLNVEAVVGFVVLISGYMICVAMDPGIGWRKLLVSRKFWAAVIGLTITLLQAFNVALPEGITPESLLGLTLLMTGAIATFGAQGAVGELPDPAINEEDYRDF